MRRFLQLAGPLTALLVYWTMHENGTAPAAMAGLVAGKAGWWDNEGAPLGGTSGLPMVRFPLLCLDSLEGSCTGLRE